MKLPWGSVVGWYVDSTIIKCSHDTQFCRKCLLATASGPLSALLHRCLPSSTGSTSSPSIFPVLLLRQGSVRESHFCIPLQMLFRTPLPRQLRGGLQIVGEGGRF
jgi:hypothetical protein